MQPAQPQDESELSALLEEASKEERPLEVIGRASKRDYGRPLQVEGSVQLEAFSGVRFYEPEELVLSVGAATPMAEIETLLDTQKQLLAFEPMDLAPLLSGAMAERRTDSIGGVVACNLAGPRRPKAGAARDHVLGVEGVSGEGARFKTGGRVVKNVTGYDLCKLLSGSFGTLAAMTQITLKGLPRAEKTRTLLFFGLEASTATALFTRAMGSAYEVSAAAHLPEPLAAVSRVDPIREAGGSVTAVRLEGPTPSVMARQAGLRRLLGDLAALGGELHAQRSLQFWREIRDCHPFVGRSDCAIWRLSLPPAKAVEALAALAPAPADAFLDWGGGLLWLARPQQLPEIPGGEALLAALGIHATLVKADAAVRAAQPFFLPRLPATTLLAERIKQSFDPKRVLNPGRLYSGL